MIQEIFDFLTTPGNSERVVGLIIASLFILIILSVLLYNLFSLFIDLIEKLLNMFKRKEKIIKVPEYIVPPVNKEIDKYIKILKEILDNQNLIKL